MPAGAVRTVGEALSSNPAEAMFLPPSADFRMPGCVRWLFKAALGHPAPVCRARRIWVSTELENE